MTPRRYVRFLVLALSLVLMPARCRAEFSLKLSVKHSEVLQYEAVTATLVIDNGTETPFVVARDVKTLPDLRFVFERAGIVEVRRIKEGSILRNLWIIPGKKESVEINVTAWYDLSTMGQYLMKAILKWEGNEYESNQVVFDVVRGMEILSVSKKVPGGSGRARKYSLRYWRRDRSEHLFLCVAEEEAGYSYGAFPLGPLVRVHKPTIEIDEEGEVKIRHQCSATCFAHTLLQSVPNGVHFLRQTFHQENGDPYPVLEGGERQKSP